DQIDVEVVDHQEQARLGSRVEQGQRGGEGQERRRDVEARGQPIAGQRCQHRHGDERHDQYRGQDIGAGSAHRASPRNGWRWWTSTAARRPRMRTRNAPNTMNATSTERATLSSTTSGMPRTPTAARIRPFSIDMKPMTWAMALRRVIIMSRPSRTT